MKNTRVPLFRTLSCAIIVALVLELFLLRPLEFGLFFSKGEEFTFSVLLELMFILLTIYLIDKVLEGQTKRKEDLDRQSVHKAALDDVRFVFEQIYSLVYEVLGASTIETSEGGKQRNSRAQAPAGPDGDANRDRDTEVETRPESGSGSSILKLILDMAVDRKLVIVIADDNHDSKKNIKWRRYLREAVDELHTEVENCQQRWGALLVAKETESQGSELMKNLSSIRRSLRKISRTLAYRDGDIHLELSRRQRDGFYSLSIESRENASIDGKEEESIDGKKEEIDLFMAHGKVADNPVMSFREFYRADEALRRENGGGNADGGKGQAPSLPEEQMGGFMSGIDERWLPGESGNADDESAPHHAREYLDKLLRFPSPPQEVAWFNVLHMYKYFHQHPDKEIKGVRLAYEATCLEFLRYAAKRGHAAAQHTLGMIHCHGSCGQRRAPAKAELWFRRAAKYGHADAQYRLGLLFQEGDGVARDIEQARKWFGCAAKHGHEDAIMLDPNRIADWRKAAAKGNPEARYRLGKVSEGQFQEECRRFQEGEHYRQTGEPERLLKEAVNALKQHAEEFLKYYRKAAVGGHVAAQYELGRIHSEGKVLFCDEPVRIIHIDVREAARWFHQVVVRRWIENRYDGTREKAAIALAKLYVQGRLSAGCFRRERRDASRWLSADIRMGAKGLLHSIEEGDIPDKSLEAQYVLGAIYQEGIHDEESNVPLVEPAVSKAKNFFERAAEKKHVGAQNRLGVMLRDSCGAGCAQCRRPEGTGAGCNLKRAFDLFRDASLVRPLPQMMKVEWWNARTNLGDMYDCGFGGRQEEKKNVEPYDYVARLKWYYRDLERSQWFDDAPSSYPPKVIPDTEDRLIAGVMYREGRDGEKDMEASEKDMEASIRFFCEAAQLVEEWNPGGAARNIIELAPERAERFIKDGKLEGTVLLEVLRNGKTAAHGLGVPVVSMDNMRRPDDLWPVAEYALGDIYEERSGRARDIELAEALYKAACSRYEDGTIGHCRSEYRLARMYERVDKHSEAKEWYHKAAKRRRDGGCGDPRAQYRLGKMYEHGDRRYGCEKDGDKAERWYLKSERPRWDEVRGFAPAQYRLGRMYESGWEGRERNAEKAASWYRKAAARVGRSRPGHAKAQYRLGKMYEHGDRRYGCEKDGDKAERWYLESARPRWDEVRGFAPAQYRLGRMYESGWEGRERNAEKAASWYRKAAERYGERRPGHAGAQYRLGRLYESGWEGRERNRKRAASWYRKAAERYGGRRPGHAGAQYRLGRLLETGWTGREPNGVKAAGWYREAANQDDVDALKWFVQRKDAEPKYEYRLGRKYEAGCEDLYQDTEEAKKLYGRAAEKGHPDAMYRLGRIHQDVWEDKFLQEGKHDNEALQRAVDLYRKAEEKGHAGSQYELGELTDRGLLVRGGIARNGAAHHWIGEYDGQVKGDEDWRNDIVKWYRKAAGSEGKGGHPGAQYAMGRFHGSGMEESYHQSVSYYRSAAEQGHRDAQFQLALKLMKGDPEEWDRYSDLGESSESSESEDRQRAQDCKEALKWFRKAAEPNATDVHEKPGHRGAEYELGNIYANGLCGAAQDFNEAVKLYRRAEAARADDRPRRGSPYSQYGLYSGDPRAFGLYAQYKLGWMYEQGWDGGDAQPDVSVEWYQKVAGSHGDHSIGDDRRAHELIVDAQYRLGRMYEQGWSGEAPDWVEAVASYLGAVQSFEEYKVGSIVDSLYRLGRICEKGWKDLEPNPEEAVRWYDKAEKRDYRRDDARADLQYRLGRMYEKGWKDRGAEPEKAVEYYHRAAASRAEDKMCHGADVPDPQARSRLEAQTCARYRLGLMYEGGWAKEPNKEEVKNPKEAVKWYRKAAEPHPDHNYNGLAAAQSAAQYRLGLMYARGSGVAMAAREAFEWIGRAADRGHEEARKWMKAVAAGEKPGYHEYRAAAFGRVFEWNRREGHKEAREDHKEAREWMEAVAASEKPGCHEYRVAAFGRVVFEWKRREAGLGHKEAREWMEAVAADKRREYRAAALGLVFEWKRRQAGEGQKEAGEGQKEARDWMKAVADGKKPECHEYRAAAQYCLGLVYEQGCGVRKSAHGAFQWMKRAAGHGHREAKEWMEEVAAGNKPEEYHGYRAAALGLMFELKKRAASQGHKEAREWMEEVAAGKKPEYLEYRAKAKDWMTRNAGESR